MLIASKPTYFGSDHVLNSQLVSEPCKFCFCCKIDPKDERNFIEHSFRHFSKSLHQGSSTRIAHTGLQVCTRKSAVHSSVYTTFLIDKHRKNTHKSHHFCARYSKT